MKLKEVSMKKALETLGATDIKVNRKGFWYVSGEFTLNGKRYRYGSFDLRGVVITGTDDIDLNADAPLYYRETGDIRKPNRFDLNERFAAAGVRVPMSKHEYDPWSAWKRSSKKTDKSEQRCCRRCAQYQSDGICNARGFRESHHPDDICRCGCFIKRI